MLLVLPLLLFLAITFIVPIGKLLVGSFRDFTISAELPRTAAAMHAWDPATGKLPDATVFETLGSELLAAKGTDGTSRVAARLNQDQTGMRSLIMKTVRRLEPQLKSAEWRSAFISIDPQWDDLQTWTTLKYVSSTWTVEHYIRALDFQRDEFGNIVRQPDGQRLYVDVFIRTINVSLTVSCLCLLLGYPIAYLLANLPSRMANALMIVVLLPFWTSILVRTTAWVVVLQTHGVLNDLLVRLGITEHGLPLMYNRFGVLVSMTHILLPYSVLSLYSVMKGVSGVYMRAARSLGAGPIRSFYEAYFPQTLPGVGAAGMLTFILSIGYYITPAIVGGPDDQLAAYYIANHVNTTLNWGMASALASILLVGVLLIYGVFVRLTGSAVKFG